MLDSESNASASRRHAGFQVHRSHPVESLEGPRGSVTEAVNHRLSSVVCNCESLAIVVLVQAYDRECEEKELTLVESGPYRSESDDPGKPASWC